MNDKYGKLCACCPARRLLSSSTHSHPAQYPAASCGNIRPIQSLFFQTPAKAYLGVQKDKSAQTVWQIKDQESTQSGDHVDKKTLLWILDLHFLLNNFIRIYKLWAADARYGISSLFKKVRVGRERGQRRSGVAVVDTNAGGKVPSCSLLGRIKFPCPLVPTVRPERKCEVHHIGRSVRVHCEMCVASPCFFS
ncbi:hypothetical protein BC832DRAFT_563412 [Gaertneriomyces semiglobifer]|nr:hypothetical protein BC832DRAFT_563412 [Gaertneriomyces semiglobifer]